MNTVSHQLLPTGPETRIDLDILNTQDTTFAVRVGELNSGHLARLATAENLDPIIVEASTMRVVDGRHRLASARQQGQKTIRTRMIEGDTDDLFRLAVQLNGVHGLPMTLSDRRSAAAKMLMRSPERSDRSIASDVGLAAATVASIRRSSPAHIEQLNTRCGRDGRWRAVSITKGKEHARALLVNHPEFTLREVAHMSGVSLGTVHNVSVGLSRERSPAAHRPTTPAPCPTSTPQTPTVSAHRANTQHPRQEAPRKFAHPEQDTNRLVSVLMRDPALRRTDRGREVLTRIRGLVPQPGEGQRLVTTIPPQHLVETITIVRASARGWLNVANFLHEYGEYPSY